MEWLVIIPLAVWVWSQGGRINALTRRVAELERIAAAALAARSPESAPAPATPAAELEPLLLDQPLPPEDDVLVLDTPLPAASNDDEPADELILTREDIAPPEPATAPAAPPIPERAEPAAAMASAPAPAVKKAPDRRLDQWLAENGFAWLGGGLFVLGAIFMVSYAAQQNWFTPPLQLGAAVTLGLALLVASEWARRASIAAPPGNPLVAALLAGAGVVALYATTWAAHGVYGFIGAFGATGLLALCAALLIGLALLHGEALGVLAIVAALLAPPLAHAPTWPSAALTLYVCAVGATGFALAAWKRWAWVAAATIAGLYFWFASAIAADEIRRAMALLSFASLGGVAVAFRKPLPEEKLAPLSWRATHGFLPAASIAASSVLMIWTWLATSPAPSGLVAGPAWVGAMFVALAAAAVRARVAAPATLAVAIGALVIGFMAYLRARFFYGQLGADFYPFVLFSAVAIGLSAIFAHPHRTSRAMIAGSGAAGAAVLTLLAASSRRDWHGIAAWAPLFTTAALLLAAAWHTARDATHPEKDNATDFWTLAGAALFALGIESAFPASVRTVAYAGAALLFAGGLQLRPWRALYAASLGAAALAVGHALSTDLIGASLSGALPIWAGLTVLAATAVLLCGGAYLAGRVRSPSATAEALTSAAVIVGIIALFLALRWFAAGGAGMPMDGFTESALRALALMAAGHVLLMPPGQETGRIAAWRGHVLLGLGLAYVLLIFGLAANPWWGGPGRGAVIGPPVFNTLLLAYAAPATVAFAAANRLYDRQRLPARIYAACGGLLALMWAMLELRRDFHGADMATSAVGLFEGACYALVVLIFALAIGAVARVRAGYSAERPFSNDLMRVMRGSAWAALIVAAFILVIARHPWWGAQDAAATDRSETGLAVLMQFFAFGLTLLLGRVLSLSRKMEPTRFAAAAVAALFAWSFGHALIRWLHHGGSMDDGAPLVGLEGFGHALWPLTLVLVAASIAERIPGRDTVRAYVHDMQAIWASAIWPALGFAALGLWYLYNPWWGAHPARIETFVDATVGLIAFVCAATLSALAPRTPRLRWPIRFARVATVAWVAHLLVATTLTVRWLHHRVVMDIAPVGDTEIWIYSAAWAVFGAGVFAFGMRRADPVLRWSGLIILLGATAYVFFLTFTRLTGVAQFGSALGLAVVLMVVAWFARARRAGAPPPGELLTITPSARRGKRHGRRQRSS